MLTVAAGDVIAVQSSTPQTNGWGPSRRQWQSVIPGTLFPLQTGFNASWRVPKTCRPGQYSIIESDSSGVGKVTIPVTVAPDPYKEVPVAKGADLEAIVKKQGAGAFRFILAGPSYTLVSGISVGANRYQFEPATAGGSVKIVVSPVVKNDKWAQTIAFSADGGGTLLINGLDITSDPALPLGVAPAAFGKVNIWGVWVDRGQAWVLNSIFRRLDYGVSAWSHATNTHIESSHWDTGELLGAGVWGGGTGFNVQSCTGGPSQQEHPIRFNLGDDNSIPSFVRVDSCTWDGKHAVMPGKEASTFRDVVNFSYTGNTHNNWTSLGQGVVTPVDKVSNYYLADNVWTVNTLNVRAGTNGPGVVTMTNRYALPLDVTARVTPTFEN